MLNVCRKFHELNIEQLLTLYRQSHLDKGRILFPYDLQQRQLAKVEDDFVDYLLHDFYAIENACYYIWTENDTYISAFRLEPYDDGALICALETNPCYRRKGYATKLINAVIPGVPSPIYSHIKRNNKASVSVHEACGFRLHHEGARLLDGSVSSLYDTYYYIGN